MRDLTYVPEPEEILAVGTRIDAVNDWGHPTQLRLYAVDAGSGEAWGRDSVSGLSVRIRLERA